MSKGISKQLLIQISQGGQLVPYQYFWVLEQMQGWVDRFMKLDEVGRSGFKKTSQKGFLVNGTLSFYS